MSAIETIGTKKKRERKWNKRPPIYTYTRYPYYQNLVIHKRFIDHCQRIDRLLEHVPTSPRPRRPRVIPPPLPDSRNEYTVLTSSYPGRTCPAQRTTPASLGASAVLCDPGPVRRLIGINEPMRQLPRPNRIERRGESRNPGGARGQPILDRAHIFLPNTFLPWNRRWRRRCSKRDFRGLFSSGLIIVWKRE